MKRTRHDGQRWAAEGYAFFRRQVQRLSEDASETQSRLPGWSRKHVMAHVAGNADAISNLVCWAATGEETPMYSSPEQRNNDIDAGAELHYDELTEWLDRSNATLIAGMDQLPDESWTAPVVTAQGRTVPASEAPWMRSREVWIHAVDLGVGVEFADLPDEFLLALIDDIQAKRGTTELPSGPAAEVAAWLAGRSYRLDGVPALGAWI